MNRPVALAVIVLGIVAGVYATLLPQAKQDAVQAVMPDRIQWLTAPYYTDGRQRAKLFGDSSKGGLWVDRVKIPRGGRVLAHTHQEDELVTVLEGTWFVGEGAKFDEAKLRPYPSGSFVVIPAGVRHFVAANEGPVILQLSGTSKFRTVYLEK